MVTEEALEREAKTIVVKANCIARELGAPSKNIFVATWTYRETDLKIWSTWAQEVKVWNEGELVLRNTEFLGGAITKFKKGNWIKRIDSLYFTSKKHRKERIYEEA